MRKISAYGTSTALFAYKWALIGGTMVEEASRRRIGELKINGTVCGNAVSLPGSVRNRYRIPLDTQPPRNERGGGKRCNSEIDGVWSPFGHPLVGIILFPRGCASSSLFSTPLQSRIRASPLLFHASERKFYLLFFFFFFCFSILTMPTRRGGRDFFINSK